jgi:RHS repeat-associated protein
VRYAHLTSGDGVQTLRTFDADYRLSALTSGSLQSLAYSHDANDRITGITNNNNSANSETFGYDTIDRLQAITSTGLGNQSMVFDANSNRSSYIWGGATDTYTPGSGNNQIPGISGARARTFGYDTGGLGNLVSATGWNGARTYSYDSFNRLSSLVNAGVTTTYTYNASGQRVRKAGAGGNFNYVYGPGGTLLGETASGGTTLNTQYIWLGGSPIAMLRGGVLYFIHNDHLGRPDTATNSSAGIVWQAQNTAFDRTVSTNTIGGLNIALPGQYYDAESGLYYNRARYYDSTMGRYIQSDPELSPHIRTVVWD